MTLLEGMVFEEREASLVRVARESWVREASVGHKLVVNGGTQASAVSDRRGEEMAAPEMALWGPLSCIVVTCIAERIAENELWKTSLGYDRKKGNKKERSKYKYKD